MMLANDPLLAGDVDLAVVVIVLVKAAITLGVVLLATMLMIWFERKAISGLQNRIGPNRAGPFGILQTLADGLKVILKEDLVPDRSDRIVFRLAPVLTMVPAFITFGLIPLGGDFRDGNGGVIEIFGHKTLMQLANPGAGVLVILAMSSIAVYGVMLAGWSSGSKYPLLGSVRASAQMVSYEAALGCGCPGRGSSPPAPSPPTASSRPRNLLVGTCGLPAWCRSWCSPRRHRRAQPSALRSGRGRAGAGRLVPDRVLGLPVRHLLPGRVPQRRHHGCHHRHAVPGRSDRPGAVRTRLGLGCGVVRAQAGGRPLRVRVDTGLGASGPLRPAHGSGLEGADPAVVRVVPAPGGHQGRRRRRLEPGRHRGRTRGTGPALGLRHVVAGLRRFSPQPPNWTCWKG
jgi:hypothetical protein